MNLIFLSGNCFDCLEEGMEIMYATKLEYKSLKEFSENCMKKQ